MLLYYQIEETDEARKKFSNAKAISSAQFFGDQSKAMDIDSQVSLQKFSVCALTLTCLIIFIHNFASSHCFSWRRCFSCIYYSVFVFANKY